MQNINLSTKTAYLIEFYQDAYTDKNDPITLKEMKQLKNGTFGKTKIHEYFNGFYEKEKEFLLKYMKKAIGAQIARGLLAGLETEETRRNSRFTWTSK